MQAPPIPANERQRLATLSSLELLDTPAEQRFDLVTRLALRLFEVPIALVSLVDEERQWFKSKQGIDTPETSRDMSFCGHAILSGDVMVVPDARTDERFADNPMVTEAPGIRFYAGVPLEAPDGHKLGTLCLIDREPREMTAGETAVLTELGALVERELMVGAGALHDSVTGLVNRRGFVNLASKAFSICRRLGQPALLLYLRFEGLAALRQAHGADAGDRALWELGEHLRDMFDDADVVARVDDDEFVVFSPGRTDGTQALATLAAEIDERNADPLEAFALRYSAVSTDLDGDRHRSLRALVDEADATLRATLQAP